MALLKELDPLEDPTVVASISTTTCPKPLKIIGVLPVSPRCTYQAVLLKYLYLLNMTLFCGKLQRTLLTDHGFLS